jgi:hypothetical protein
VDRVAALLDEIDAGHLRPRSHVVSRKLVELEGFADPLAAEIVRALDTGEAVPKEPLLKKLWSRINEAELPRQGALRTLVALLQPDEPIDGYYAGYLIGWAQDEGVSTEAIISAFRAEA